MASRRGRGEGSIRQRPDGRWEARTSISGQRLSAYGRTRKAAVAGLAEARAAVEAGLLAPSNRLTVAIYLEGWVERVAQRVRARTADGYASHVRLHLAPSLGTVPLVKLTPQHVEKMTARMVERGLNPHTASHARTVLRIALRDAERAGLIGRNAAALAMRPRVAHVERSPLTPAEVRELLNATREDRLHALYATAIASGARSGELRALRWDDLDSAALTINRTIQRRAGEWTFEEPKTARSRRTIPLAAVAVEALRLWRARQLRERLAAGSAWQGETWGALIFTNEAGAPLSEEVAVRSFHAALARAGLPRQRLHDLRHAAATNLLVAGTPIHVVSQMLGHAGIAITANVYGHVTTDAKRDAADRMQSLLAAR